MEYKVVSAITIKGLEKTVNELLGDGWEPIEGVSAGSNALFQSLVKKTK